MVLPKQNWSNYFGMKVRQRMQSCSRKRDVQELLNGPQLMEVIQLNDKSQTRSKLFDSNYSSDADGEYAEPLNQKTLLTEDPIIIDADAVDDIPDIEMMVWEQVIPKRKIETSTETEMTEILNNKGGWLTALLTSAEDQQLDKSQWYVAQHGSYTVRLSSMLTLRDKQWLNDEIINFYHLVILADKDEVMCSLDSTRTKSHFFGSFFLQQLYNDKHQDSQVRGKYDYNSAERTWNGEEKLFQCNNLFFVNNESNLHWTVIVVQMFTRRIIHYDSLTNRRNKNKGGRMHSQKLDGILQYLEDRYEYENPGGIFNKEEWTIIDEQNGVPQQENRYDCGVYACFISDFVCRGLQLHFSQTHIEKARDIIAQEILSFRQN
jgi:hypothetical protein